MAAGKATAEVRLYTLHRKVAAIQACEPPDDNRIGLITELPSGAELKMLGVGFNETTALVMCNGFRHFVFYVDLDGAGDSARLRQRLLS